MLTVCYSPHVLSVVSDSVILSFRMFDSQNNDRGGYNVGSLYYYEGSVLPIEW